MLDRATLDTLPTDDLAALDIRTESLTNHAVMLMGYQRTKQISKEARIGWEKGDLGPLAEQAKTRRDEIIQGTLIEIWREYLPLRAHLTDTNRRPAHVADIGCGAGVNDVFLARDFAPKFTLIDIEQTDDQYHGWAKSGAGYASLAAARALLEENDVPPGDIHTINPRLTPERLAGLTPDLVTSLYSCGFHYPIDEYLDLFLQTVANGGLVVLDLRGRYYRRRSPALDQLYDAGTVTELYQDQRSVRIAVG